MPIFKQQLPQKPENLCGLSWVIFLLRALTVTVCHIQEFSAFILSVIESQLTMFQKQHLCSMDLCCLYHFGAVFACCG